MRATTNRTLSHRVENPAADDRWPARRAYAFIAAASLCLWAAIILAIVALL